MVSDVDTTMNRQRFKAKVLSYLNYTAIDLGQKIEKKSLLKAICMTVNDTIFSELQSTKIHNRKQHIRSFNYFSLEYLIGRMLSNNLHNIGIYNVAKEAISELGFELEDVCEEGYDLALGNGGLGRLAACYLDSMVLARVEGEVDL